MLIGNQRAAGALASATGVPRWLVDPVVDGRDSQSLAAIAVGSGIAVGVFNRALGGVIAWDRATGAERWRVERPYTVAINATPVIANGTVYFANGRDEVVALDLLTGALRWQTALDPGVTGHGRSFGVRRGPPPCSRRCIAMSSRSTRPPGSSAGASRGRRVRSTRRTIAAPPSRASRPRP